MEVKAVVKGQGSKVKGQKAHASFGQTVMFEFRIEGKQS
jgi:hypothetical protein